MSKRILSVSYDANLLATREMLLAMNGHSVTSALGFSQASQAMGLCRVGTFELFILGHSIPHDDKLELIKIFRQNCAAPVLSLVRYGEPDVPCDFHASPDDPGTFLKTVDEILGKEADASPNQ